MSQQALATPQFFVLAEDLGKSLSGLHKARGLMGEVTDLQQLSIPFLPLETSASTQKVLADEASSENPPRSSLSHPHPLRPPTPYHRPQLGLPASCRCPQVLPPGGSAEKLGVSKGK
jgi:hypothetical protein